MKSYKLFLISHLVLLNITFTLFPLFYWGFSGISGDESRHFIRLTYFNSDENIDLTYFPVNDYNVNAVPPGLTVFLSIFMRVTGIENLFITKYIISTFFTLLSILTFSLIFIKNLKFKYLFFLPIVSFMYYISPVTDPYTNTSAISILRGIVVTAELTFILVLIFILLIFDILRERLRPNLIIFVIFALLFFAQISSHVGGVVFHSVLIFFLCIYLYLQRSGKNGPLFLSTVFILITSSLLSLFLIIIMYYNFFAFKDELFAFTEPYLGVDFLTLIAVTIMIIVLSFLVYNYKVIETLMSFTFNNNNRIVESTYYKPSLFLIVYIIGSITYTWKGPMDYTSSNISLSYPIYFGIPSTINSITAVVYGLTYFFISFIGFKFLCENRSQRHFTNIILILHLLCFAFLFPYSIRPTRLTVGSFMIAPILAILGLYYLYKILINYSPKFSHIAIFFLACNLIIVPTAQYIYQSRLVVENYEFEKNKPLGHSPEDPYISYNFINSEFPHYIDSQDNVVASPHTQTILGDFSVVQPTVIYEDFSSYIESYSELYLKTYYNTEYAFLLSERELAIYNERFNSKYLIKTNLDKEKSNEDYESSEFLIKIYENSNSETIYYIDNSQINL